MSQERVTDADMSYGKICDDGSRADNYLPAVSSVGMSVRDRERPIVIGGKETREPSLRQIKTDRQTDRPTDRETRVIFISGSGSL